QQLNMTKEHVLVIGANGQIGSVLTNQLRRLFGKNQVIATDIRPLATEHDGPFEILDVLNKDRLAEIIQEYQISQIYHLAAILSAKGEQKPVHSWDINMTGLLNILEVGRNSSIKKIFFPSSIAVFGPNVPRDNTPQEVVLTPTTVYGISKVAGEIWCQYYYDKYGLDVRSLRYPGIIGHQSLPGGGTTDYAVHIYHEALNKGRYECFLAEDMELPMIYMDDAIRATIELMEAPAEQIKIRTSYNLAGMSFNPAQQASSIRKHLPDFQISYAPDYRQAIAASWPNSIDDRAAQNDWHWKPAFDLPGMTLDMLQNLQAHQLTT
ncbi:MAG: NAD-dependent epimerase/dehydratase family protein, partial [Bacteroidota bacterium]